MLRGHSVQGADAWLGSLLAAILISAGCALPQQVGSDCVDEAVCEQLNSSADRVGGGGISSVRSMPRQDVRRAGFIERADVLFVVNDSPAMETSQNALAAAMPAFVRALATGDSDHGGRPDFRAVPDLHLGVISGRMASWDLSQPGPACGATEGSGGLLSSRCMPVSGRYASTRNLATIERAGSDLACMVQLGKAGCLLPQPFEAALEALSTSAATADSASMPVTYGGSSVAPGNEGFLRRDSLIVVIMVSDVDDCSSTSPPAELRVSDPARLLHRCSVRPDVRAPLDRYLQGLQQLRAGAEDLVMFFALAGIPPMLGPPPEQPDLLAGYYQKVLKHPGMESPIVSNATPESGDDVPPAMCTTSSGPIYPARRMAELAQGFGPNGVVLSLCDPLEPALRQIARAIGERLGPPGI